MKQQNANPLWTHDFTIITLGSVVSMFGNAMSGFAMSLLVLDYTSSPFLYAIYIALFTLPQIVMPVFSGAFLDRFSRKRMIYTLDFLSAVLYAAAAMILATGWFSFPVFAIYTFLIGSINSVYTVAYESFYPLLISEGNYSKAYSISSVLETVSAVMVPVATFAYNQVGIAPLFGINAVSFLIAAIVETRIRTKEEYVEKQKATAESKAGKQLLIDMIEGGKYLLSERGLFAVAVYFTFSAFAGGASQVITLPFFKSTFENGEYVYMLVWGMALVGRGIGGIIHYFLRIPVRWKYRIAFFVYLTTCTIEGLYLYFGIPVMMAMCFASGILGITSYTIRVSATQSYVPDEKKGRFNGAFNMLNTIGSLSGELLAGAVASALPPQYVLTGFMAINALSAVVFIGGNRRHVAKIYNTQQ